MYKPTYIEFKEGEKHAAKGADRSFDHEHFKDCGYLLTDEDVIIDIDHLSKEQIRKMIERFNIKTQTVWTNRGAHLYFSKSPKFSRARNGVCALGFEIETKTSKNTPDGITIKRNGVMRDIENEGIRMVLPWFFSSYKKYPDMTGIAEGEGRNTKLFAFRGKLNEHGDSERILRFINEVLFADPLPEEEFKTVIRNYEFSGDKDGEYEMATTLMNQLRIVVYQGCEWYWNGTHYVPDNDENIFLKKTVFNHVPGVKTKFVDETVKQIHYRAERPENRDLPIRFKNGILDDGTFYEIKDYKDFTPYYIDINYNKDAEVVPEVDDYINAIVSNDDSYRMLLLEAMSYPLIINPERMRSIGKFFLFRGDGANGKGTLLQIMQKIYNARNCTSLSIKELLDPRYQVTLVGKLCNLGDDIQPDAINTDQMKIIKNLCTADTVAVRRLYKQAESATLTAKLFFTTNSDIKTFEKGYAYKRRVMWLPMFNVVEAPDPNFISKMTSEKALEYWIRLIVEAYMRLYENRKFTDSETVDAYNKQYHKENNYMAAFLDTLNIESDVLGKKGKDMRKLYEEYNDDDCKPYKPKLLNEALKEIGIVSGFIWNNGRSERVYIRQDDEKKM